MNLQTVLASLRDWIIPHGLKVVLVLIIMVVLIKSAAFLADRFVTAIGKRNKKADEEFRKRVETLSSIIKHVISLSCVITAFLIILDEIGIEIGPILAAAGILGLAVGFGAQSLVKDVIAGFFIFLEDQIRVGDVVEIAGKSGLVQKVNLKMTVLRDLSGNVHFIPNGHIDVVTNMTKGYSMYVFEIGVSYRENVDEVMRVMVEVDESLRNDPEFGPDILQPLEMLGLDKFADSALIIKARTTTKPIKQWRTAREFNRRLKQRFDELNIEIPFPHITLYAGKDKQNQSPPFTFSQEKRD